jgi:SPP1 family predicted phage head-tail adaptor
MRTASRLRERVRIEKRSTSDDGYGGQTVSWVTHATVFAQIEPVFGIQSERQVADQRQASAGYRVRIRQRSDLDASMRVVWKTHTLWIHSIHEQGELTHLLTYEENV